MVLRCSAKLLESWSDKCDVCTLIVNDVDDGTVVSTRCSGSMGWFR